MAAPVPSTSLVVVSSLIAACLSVFYLTSGSSTCHLVPLSALAVCGLVFCGYLRWRGAGTAERRVCVVVVGDIGRSPRMQYHALSLSRHGYQVDLVGFLGTKPHNEVLNEERITITAMADVKGVQVGPRVVSYVTKVIAQSVQILVTLMETRRPSHILLQNPPGLPSMAVCWLLCLLRGSRLVVDWHNYGFTILALAHPHTHPLVRLAQWYERAVGPLAALHLCVSEAMKEDLQENWGIRATTLYDRPPAIFKEAPLELRHQLFLRLAQTLPSFRTRGEEAGGAGERTAFTLRDPVDQSVTWRPHRPALLISSTSWTEDEDFSVLLKALEEYERCVREERGLPALVCVITGKGPQKEYYKKLIDGLHLEHVQICTPWLEAEDYPTLLGSADLGVCLHRSSSGLDLPMKVVDMFGCCLPVCAIHYNCLSELVKHEENGLVFRDSQELASQLQALLSGFPRAGGRLEDFRRSLQTSRGQRWDDNWTQTVLPLITMTTPSP
ncbi:unnamed protein product [Arctogadus glacialis]